MPITYNGNNTDNLFVAGWKNGKSIKLKVKNLSCHDGIIVEPIVQNTDEYKTSTELSNNINNLEEGTVYHVDQNGTRARFLYYEKKLHPLDSDEKISSGLNYGNTYKTYNELYNDRANLINNTLYSVSDKGTIEQYLYQDNNLIQIGNNINEITEGDESNFEEVSATPVVENGIIEYNMVELVNGDYRYKNHTELQSVISDMPNLISGIQMFMGTSLDTFCGDLSSLEEGRDMFGRGCRLDEASIINIIDSIPDYSKTDTVHHLTISHASDVDPDLINEMSREAQNKNWEIEWLIYNS